MKGYKVFFSHDGANEGAHHIVKVASWWRVDRVMNVLLCADATVGTNQITAEAIDISLKNRQCEKERVKGGNKWNVCRCWRRRH